MVAAHPDWLALPGRTVVALGAGAEVGPLPVLLGWGARVVGVDLPGPGSGSGCCDGPAQRWDAGGPGGGGGPGGAGDGSGDGEADLARGAGLDLTDGQAVADWLAAVDGPLVLGNYVYADGGNNVRLASAVDALTVRLRAARGDVALAFLATPTDVFVVPADAVAQSVRAYATRSAAGQARHHRCAWHPAGGCSAGPTRPGPTPASTTAWSPSRPQLRPGRNGCSAGGPPWHARPGQCSPNVAPPTRTRSVLKNRALAAAYAGAHRFGVEVFEPATTKTLMAALLVHDLHTSGARRRRTPGRTRRMRPRTAACGASPTLRAAR